MRRDDPKVLETVERLLKEGKSQRQVPQLVDEMLAVDPPFRTRDVLWAWLRRQPFLAETVGHGFCSLASVPRRVPGKFDELVLRFVA